MLAKFGKKLEARNIVSETLEVLPAPSLEGIFEIRDHGDVITCCVE